MQPNIQLRCNKLLNKRLDVHPIVFDDIGPTSKWVKETQPTKFDLDLDIHAMEFGGGVGGRRRLIPMQIWFLN